MDEGKKLTKRGEGTGSLFRVGRRRGGRIGRCLMCTSPFAPAAPLVLYSLLTLLLSVPFPSHLRFGLIFLFFPLLSFTFPVFSMTVPLTNPQLQ
jgi:hypothetical protein